MLHPSRHYSLHGTNPASHTSFAQARHLWLKGKEVAAEEAAQEEEDEDLAAFAAAAGAGAANETGALQQRLAAAKQANSTLEQQLGKLRCATAETLAYHARVGPTGSAASLMSPQSTIE